MKPYSIKFLLFDCLSKTVGLAFLVLIRAYQIILSPILGPACRFTPSCSEYAYQAISRYGPVKGAVLSLMRILRCHPFHPGGVDPVP